MSPPWGSLPTGLQVSVPFISPEGCTISNRRQRLRTMLTPAPICLEGNTSPCMTYSLSGYDWIGCRMTTGVARGYSRYSPSGCYWPVSSPPCHFRTHQAVSLRASYGFLSSEKPCFITVHHMEYGRMAIGIRSYGNWNTIVRQMPYGDCLPLWLSKTTTNGSDGNIFRLKRIYAVGAQSVALYDREKR